MSDLQAIQALGRQVQIFPCRREAGTVQFRGKPVLRKPKSPLTEHGFEDASQERAQIDRWAAQYPNCLWGVPTGSRTGLVVIDYDTEKADEAAREWLTTHSEALLATRSHSTVSGGRHYLFRSQGRYSSGVSVTLGGIKRKGLDIRAEGGYIIWWPLEGLNVTGEVAELPANLLEGRGIESRELRPLSAIAPQAWDWTAPEVADALAFLDPEDYDCWIHNGMSIHAASGGSDKGFSLWSAWSSGELTGETPRNFSGLDDLRYRWDSFSSEKPRERVRGLGSLFQEAKSRGYVNGHANGNGALEAPPHTDTDAPNGSNSAAPDEAKPAPAIQPYPLIWYSEVEGVVHHKSLISRLLLQGSFCVIYGESNSGKTFLALDMALSIAQGGFWRDRRTAQGLVIYVAGEGSTSVRNRVSAYRKVNPEVAAGIPLAILPNAVNFMTLEPTVRLVETIKAGMSHTEQPPALVIVDTLARAMAGAEENSTQDMGIMVDAADYIRQETGAALAFIHHSGKDPTRGARGSSALRAATDTEILVEGQSGTRTVSVTKQRDLELGDRMAFDLSVVEIGTDSETFLPITSCVVKHNLAAAAVITPEFRGKNQKLLIKAMRARATEQFKVWSISEMRGVGKELGMSRSTAQSSVDSVVNSPYMKATIGGYLFVDGND